MVSGIAINIYVKNAISPVILKVAVPQYSTASRHPVNDKRAALWHTNLRFDCNCTIQDFIQPMYDVIPAIYLGIDVAIDDKGKFYIIEINKAPGLEMFVRDNGLEPIVEMQKYIINDQQNEQQRNQNSNTK